MELATNLFTKGLQLDTHPMVQSNDTLTDCLNGTLITMNGNEVILLNDMGNRRVDNAFLPSGYEPVGMKEYGGIIYVAAYNPITNKSQIGSFPSPEKIIDINDDENLGGEFDFESILRYTKTVEELEDKYEGPNVEKDRYLEIPVIKADSFLVPLTNDTSLRAGDKFTVYASGLSSLKDLLTNYDNVFGGKVKSPKNKRYTLLLGILNSQNEFVDITKTLCRWDIKTWKILDKENYSDLYNFNRGYFIPDEFNNETIEYTINDAKLIKERLKIATNTYSYKLIGPLYLKVIFNHIEEFDYNIYGYKNENDNTYTITIEGYIKYNCVDSDNNLNINSLVQNPDVNYRTYDEIVPELSAFDLWYKKDKDSKKILQYYEITGDYMETEDAVKRDKSKYDPITNLYSTKITKTFTKIEPNKEDGKTFEYVLGVLADKSSSLYIRGLSVKNSIDLSLLGSGIVRFNGWLFLNDVKNKTTTFLFNINSYPEEGITHTDLRFEFTSVTDSSVHKLLVGDLYNGQITLENESWSSIGLEERTVYTVEAFYRKKKSDGTYEYKDSIIDKDSKKETGEFRIENGKIGDTNITATRWLLTTELFNEFYKKSEVPDFCTTLNEEFLDKMKIYLEVSSDSVKANVLKEDDEFIGSLISKTLDISYSCKHGYNVKLSGIPELGILNEEYYPSEIKIKPNSYTIQSETPIISSVNEKLVVNNNYDTLFKNNLDIIDKNSQNLNLNDDNFLEYKIYDNDEIEVIFYDRYKAIGEEPENIYNIFAEMSTLNHKGGPFRFGNFGCILLNYQDSEHWKFIDVYHNLGFELLINIDEYYCIKGSHLCFRGLPSGSDTFNRECNRIYMNDSKETLELSYGEFSGNVDLIFNAGIYKGLMFMYMFPGNRVWYSNATDMYCYNDLGSKIDYGEDAHDIVDNETYSGTNSIANPSYNHGAKYARVWWRTSDNGWALFKDMLNINESFTGFIKRQFNNIDYIYCMYDDYNSYKGTFEGREITIFVPNNNYIYNQDYKIPIDISFKFKLNRLVEENSNTLTNNGVEDIFGKKLKKEGVIYLYDDIIENNILSNRADSISSTNEILDIPNKIKIGNLKFTESLSLNKVSYILKLELVSSETFYKNINNQSNKEISGIYINGDDYIILDSTGNNLKSNSIYYYRDKKLIKANNLRFLMINDDRSKNGSQNILVYNAPEGTSEKLMFKYDHSGNESNTHIMLDYSDARIVTL